MITESWHQVSFKFGNRSKFSPDELSMAEDAAKQAYKLARSELFRNHITVSDAQEKHDHHIINGSISLLLLGYQDDFKALAHEIFEEGRRDVRYKPVGLAMDMMLRVLGQKSARA